MDNNNYKQLLGILATEKTGNSLVVEKLLMHLLEKETDAQRQLVIKTQPYEMHQLQGAIKTMQQLIEILAEPQKIIRQIEKR